MNKILVVIICAATQLPKKLTQEIEKALGEAGFAYQNTDYEWNLSQVIHHSEKKKDPIDTGEDTVVKIYAHYIEITTYHVNRSQEQAEEAEAVVR